MEWKEQKKLQERYGKITSDMRSMVEKAEKEDRSLSADEKTSFEAQKKEAQEIRERLETVREVEDFNAKDLPGYVDLSAKDQREYSLMRVIRSRVENKELDGFEKEVSDEIEKRVGSAPQGIYVPYDLKMDKRDLDTTAGTGAVGTRVDSTLIELLRSQMLVRQLGARVMTNMQGKFALPRQSGSVTASWVAEGGDAGESNATLDQVAFTPITLHARTDLTRSFIKQSSVDAEQFAREDLATTLAVEIDRTALDGSGTSPEPAGITNTSGVNTVTWDVNNKWTSFVNMETALLEDKALRGSLAYVLSPTAYGLAKTYEKASNTARFILEGGQINGYNAVPSNNLANDVLSGSVGGSSGSAIFGNFNDLVIAFWGGLDLIVNPYSISGGGVRLEALQDADVQVRHAASFCVMDDIYAG